MFILLRQNDNTDIVKNDFQGALKEYFQLCVQKREQCTQSNQRKMIKFDIRLTNVI